MQLLELGVNGLLQVFESLAEIVAIEDYALFFLLTGKDDVKVTTLV